MTKEQRLIIAEKYAELFPTLGKEHLLSGALIDELNYVHLKCARYPELDYIEEFQKVMDIYTFSNMPIPESIIEYKNNILRLGKPKWYHVNHYELNDSVSYIGEYYDGTPTAEYRKKNRYPIKPLCPEFLSNRGTGTLLQKKKK